MNKHTAIDPSGKVHKRNSESRLYSFVVLTKSVRCVEAGDDSWSAYTWCGTQARAYQEMARLSGKPAFAAVTIAPTKIVQTQKKSPKGLPVLEKMLNEIFK